MVPPASSVRVVLKNPVPCISGDIGRMTGTLPCSASARTPSRTSSSVVGTARPLSRNTAVRIPSRPFRSQITPFGRPVVPPVSRMIPSVLPGSPVQGSSGPVAAASS